MKNNIHNVLQDFESKLLRHSNIKLDTYKPQQFRGSGLPICPLRWALVEILNDNKVQEESSLGLDFFAGFGTILHSSLQRWSGFHGKIYGDWEYHHEYFKKIDGKIWKRVKTEVVKNKLGPVKTKDGKDMIYREFTVKHPDTGLTGHVDCLIPYKDGFIVLDYKTSSANKIIEMEEPPINYHNQIHTYWYLLENYGPVDLGDERKGIPDKYRRPLKIYGSVIFMISRDNPFAKDGTKMFLAEENDTESVLANFKNYKRAKKAVKTKKFDAVIEHRTCTCKADTEGCEFAVLGCGLDSERVKKAVKDLIE